MTPPFATAPGLAGLAHGFFGREGGVSRGDFASLDMSLSLGDDPGAVSTNRARACAALGFAPEALLVVRQVHSNRVVTVTDRPGDAALVEADAIVTQAPGLLLGILTADCAPILLADPGAGIIAAAHAGWRGAVDGIIGNTVAAMAALGAVPARIVGAIGPTISQANYEVGGKFEADLLVLHPGAARFFAAPAGGIVHFDLPGFVAAQLHAAGVGQVEDCGLCTYALAGQYFSHRRATHRGTGAGRQLALIGLS